MGLGKLLARQAPPRRQEDRAFTGFGGTEFVTDVSGVDTFGFGHRYQGGMTIPGAWRCALLLSDLLGRVPWYAYRQRAGRPIEKLDPTPLVLQKPNPQETGMATRSSWALDLIWHGNALGIIAARNSEGWPTAVIPIPATMVGIRRVLVGGLASVLPLGAIEYDIGGMVFGPEDVLHIKGPCEPGEIRGLGVLEAHMTGTLELAHEQLRQARSLSQHGVPTGYLKAEAPTLDEQEASDLKTKWMASQRTRTVAVLNATTTFEPLSWDPEKMQLVDARKFTLHELANIFGLPLSFLGADQATRTYTNIEQDAIMLREFGSLGGHIARFEQTFSDVLLPAGTWTAAHLDSVLGADRLTRYQANAIGIDKGFVTVDEAREEDNRAPLPTPPGTPPQPLPSPTVDPAGGQANPINEGDQAA